jgi:hypothetical protein
MEPNLPDFGIFCGCIIQCSILILLLYLWDSLASTTNAPAASSKRVNDKSAPEEPPAKRTKNRTHVVEWSKKVWRSKHGWKPGQWLQEHVELGVSRSSHSIPLQFVTVRSIYPSSNHLFISPFPYSLLSRSFLTISVPVRIILSRRLHARYHLFLIDYFDSTI